MNNNDNLNHFRRDLVGNIITTITCCLVVGQVANLMGIFTEFRNHYNFLVLGEDDKNDIFLAFKEIFPNQS